MWWSCELMAALPTYVGGKHFKSLESSFLIQVGHEQWTHDTRFHVSCVHFLFFTETSCGWRHYVYACFHFFIDWGLCKALSDKIVIVTIDCQLVVVGHWWLMWGHRHPTAWCRVGVHRLQAGTVAHHSYTILHHHWTMPTDRLYRHRPARHCLLPLIRPSSIITHWTLQRPPTRSVCHALCRVDLY